MFFETCRRREELDSFCDVYEFSIFQQEKIIS